MIQRFKILVLIVVIMAGSIGADGQQINDESFKLKPLQSALDAIKADVILDYVKKLASDEFEGRAPGTRGERLTVDYLVDQFKGAGLKVGNPNGTFVQRVPLVGYQSVPNIEVESGGQTQSIKFIDDFVHDLPALRATASKKNIGVVFAGYGIVAPEFGWDDYKGVDIRNKLVIVLSGEPSRPDKSDPTELDPSFFRGGARTYYSTRESKYDLAAKKGAAGILVVYDPEKASTYSIFQTFAKMEGFGLKPKTPNTQTIIFGLLTTGAARRIFSLAEEDFDTLQVNADLPDRKPVVTNAKANISVKSKIRDVASHNVVARVDGSDPLLKSEYVVYSSHWDHLGKDTSLNGDQIYNGAIDDAIGTAQLLEIARGFAKLPIKPKRSILFIATTAEEKGFLGSRYYARDPLFPIAKTVANINLDAGNVWGRTKDIFSASYGLSTLDEVLEDAAKLQGRTFLKESLRDGGMYFASDQIEFAKAGIPAIFPFSGSDYVGKPKDFGDAKWGNYSDKDYHQVSDEVRTDWNLSGAVEDCQWLLIAGYNIAQNVERPAWKKGIEFRRRSGE